MYWILFLFATLVASIISTIESDQQFTDSDGNIHVYLSPPSEKKTIVHVPAREENLEPELKIYKIERNVPAEKETAIKVVGEGEKLFLVEPNSQPLEDQKKYELEREGPNKKKITIKVIKEDRETYEVNPKLISSNKFDISESQEPRIEYKKIDIKQEQPRDENIILKVISDNQNTFSFNPQNNDNAFYQTEYKQLEPDYKIIKQDKAKDQNLFVNIVKENKIPVVTKPKYQSDDIFYELEQGSNSDSNIKLVISENSKPGVKEALPTDQNVGFKFEEAKQKGIVVKFIEDHQDSHTINPIYQKNISYLEPTFKGPESDYDKYGIKKPEPKDIVLKVIKEDEKSLRANQKHKYGETYLEPNYEIALSAPEYQKWEPVVKGYDVKVEEQEEEKVNKLNPKYKDEEIHFDPQYKKSVRVYKGTEPEYQEPDNTYTKYESKDEEGKEKKVILIGKEDFESNYENTNHFKPDYIKYGNRYEKPEIDFKKSESEHKNYGNEYKETELVYTKSEYDNTKHDFIQRNQEKKRIYLNNDYENKKTSEKNDQKYNNKYENPELEVKKLEHDTDQHEIEDKEPETTRIFLKNDPNYKGSLVKDEKHVNDDHLERDYREFANDEKKSETKSLYYNYKDKHEPIDKKELLVYGNNEEKTFDESEYEYNKNFKPEYRTPDNEHVISDSGYDTAYEDKQYFETDEKSKHDVVVKIWTKQT